MRGKHAATAPAPPPKPRRGRPRMGPLNRAPPLELPTPSPEQAHAIKTFVSSTSNLIINACAGSGKTTTILHLAKAAGSKQLLMLVYNRRLMLETRKKKTAVGLKNLDVFDYHAFANHFYSPGCAADQSMKRVVIEDMPVMDGKTLPGYDIIVLDEQQDMTPLFAQFVRKVIRDITNARGHEESAVRGIFLGDPRQEIYGFKLASARFLTEAGRLFDNGHPFVEITLKKSHRLSKQIAVFINEQTLGQGEKIFADSERDDAGKPHPLPRYVICDTYRERPLDEVLRLIDKIGLRCDDILILAPSVKRGSLANRLANSLARRNYPVHFSNYSSDDVSFGKILFCTYHRAKGIEREAAVVLGFDESYWIFYDRHPRNLGEASNAQHVAITRAKRHLSLIHCCNFDYLPFIVRGKLEEHCEVVQYNEIDPKKFGGKAKAKKISVTDLISHVSDPLLSKCLLLLRYESVHEACYCPCPATTIPIGAGFQEDVADITGTAAPAVYEWHTTKKLSSFNDLFDKLSDPSAEMNEVKKWRPKHYRKLKDTKKLIKLENITTADILFLANFSMAMQHGSLVKLYSIPLLRYKWLKDQYVDSIIHNLSVCVPGEGVEYEKQLLWLGFPRSQPEGTVDIEGRCDIYRSGGSRAIWEVKYTQSLSEEGILQVAVYAAMLQAKFGEAPLTYLVNARTGQVVRIVPKHKDSLRKIVQNLVNNKPGGMQDGSMTNEEFFKEADNGFKNDLGPLALPAWFSKPPVKGRK